MYGDLSSQMRGQGFQESAFRGTAADKAAEFNKGLQQDFRMARDAQKLDMEKQRWGRTKDVYEGGRESTNDVYSYGVDPLKFRERATALKIGQNTTDTGNVVGGQKFMVGENDAKAAADKLSQEDFNLLNPGTWF
jgi:hypothetical protein